MAIMTVLSVAGCGDCVSIGTPAVYLSAREAVTGQSVPLAYAAVSYTHQGAWRRAYPGASGTPTICCTSGWVQLRIEKQGYATWDTTVTVRTRGQCDTPVSVTIVATLRPTSQASEANKRGRVTARSPEASAGTGDANALPSVDSRRVYSPEASACPFIRPALGLS